MFFQIDIFKRLSSAHQWKKNAMWHAGLTLRNNLGFSVFPKRPLRHEDRRRWTANAVTSGRPTLPPKRNFVRSKFDNQFLHPMKMIQSLPEPPHPPCVEVHFVSSVAGEAGGWGTWPIPRASIRALGNSLTTTWSITGSGPSWHQTVCPLCGGGWRGGVDIGPLCSPEHEQIASHQDPET